jgi:hypothetical protein
MNKRLNIKSVNPKVCDGFAGSNDMHTARWPNFEGGHLDVNSWAQGTADETTHAGDEKVHAHWFARGDVLTHATSNRNGPACLSEIRKPADTTRAGSRGGASVNTRPRKVGTKSLNANRCSSHSPRRVLKAHW